MKRMYIWARKSGKTLQFGWKHCRLPPILTAFCLTDDKTEVFSSLSLHFVVVEVFSFRFFWKGVTEQQKGCLCFSWLWQFGSGGLWGGKGGDYSVCTHMERLLTKHMSCSLQRSRCRPSLRGQGEDTFLETQRETLKVAATQEAVWAAGLQSIWRESSFWKERECRGKICFPNFCLLHHKTCSWCIY